MTTSSIEIYLTCNGAEIKQLAEAGLHWLTQNHRYVNELNVFPVPDGDTGTNMMLTMQNAYKEIQGEDSTHAGKVLNKLAHGAMMGSRGNSGTILSQLWKGLAHTLSDYETFNARDVIRALRTATDTAYRGVQRPVEGTILTVAREITEFCETWLKETIENTIELPLLLENMVQKGWEAVQKTPDLLPVLKKAGVVDSGGTGLMYVLEGMLRYIKGQSVEITDEDVHALSPHDGDFEDHEPVIEMPNENIYDVQFVIKGENLVVAPIKSAIEQMGDSAVIVGNDKAVKVHVHVRNPGIPLQYAANVGALSDIVVENMLEQYYEYLAKRKQPTDDSPTNSLELREIEPHEIAVIAVTAGVGMGQVFQQLEVAALVEGGQTNNPSTQEILDAIEKVNTDKVIILPNNKNIILTAQQAAQMTHKKVIVVPTRSFPQGVSAILHYHPEGNLEEVAAAMTDAKDNIMTGEITTATRSVELNGVDIAEGQIIGLLNGDLKIAGDDLNDVVHQLIGLAIENKAMELITLYYGQSIEISEVSALLKNLAEGYPELEFEAVYGGQPHYQYIFSVE